jgi:cytochrome c biogenesis protein CcmG/thiol:disulfide interchange protein DsbE
MNKKILVIGGLVVLPLLLVLAAGMGKNPKGRSDNLQGRVAPVIVLDDLDGNPVDIADWRGGPVVINFWATWCIPCAQEHPYLVQAAQAYADKGVHFLGIVYGDDPDKARAWLDERGSAYPTVLDPGRRVAIDFGVVGVPETFFLDKSGQIMRKISGPVQPSVMVRTLDSLL